MKSIKDSARSSGVKKGGKITGGQFKQGYSARYANGGAVGSRKGEGKTQINIIVGTGRDEMSPPRVPVMPPIGPAAMPGGQPPLGGIAGPLRRNGGRT